MRQMVLTALIFVIIVLLGTTAGLWIQLHRQPVVVGPRISMPITTDGSEPSDPAPTNTTQTTFRVAAIQASSEFGEPEINRKHLRELIEAAAAQGAQVIVLPEAAVTGYLPFDLRTTWQLDGHAITEGLTGRDPRSLAETVPGESTRYFSSLASQLQIYLTVPLVEIDKKTNRLFNSIVLIGPSGAVLRHYRKRNPWPWAERGWATPGDLGNPVVDTPFGRFGMLICYDIHEQAKILAEQKVDTLLYCIAWVDDADSDWFTVRLPAVAQRYKFNVVGANWTVPSNFQPAWSGFGQSLIVSKFGTTLAKARENQGDEIVIADLPIDR